MAENSLDKARKEINEIDKEMTELFVRRMQAAKAVAEYKKTNNLPILDKSREKEIIERGASLIDDENIRGLYRQFIKKTMELSRSYQSEIIGLAKGYGRLIHVNLGKGYNIHIGSGLIDKAGEIFDLTRRVLILTDSGVPSEYAQRVKVLCSNARIMTVDKGEGSKNLDTLERVEREMLDFNMTRSDCVVAVGGGVVGDIAGFAASSYMRGVDFYNIPTTLLSQLDSSIGGKTGVNLGGVKNIVGTFYQPTGVIIDPELLKTLPKRHFASGLAEAIKMSLTSSGELFELIEAGDTKENIEKIITEALLIKKFIVESDEREGGIRKILNFGHTLGHAIEACEIDNLYHGECVAIGMTAVCSGKVKERLMALLKKIGLPCKYHGDLDRVMSFIARDKKRENDGISVVFVDEIGSFRIEKMNVGSFCDRIREELK